MARERVSRKKTRETQEYKGKKMYARASHPLEYIFTRAKKCTQGRPTPLSTFLHCKKKCNHTRGTSLSTFSLLALRQKNVLKGVGGP